MRAHYRASARLLWHYPATLSDHLTFDPAGLDGWGEANHAARGENRTARIDETVIGPLIAWALRFTDEIGHRVPVKLRCFLMVALLACGWVPVRAGPSGRGYRSRAGVPSVRVAATSAGRRQVVIDDHDLRPRPAQRHGSLGQRILQPR
jgi:hypothetical protein